VAESRTEDYGTGLTLNSVYLGMVMKTVLVTGGSRGLGRATAEKLAVLGHRVILVARNPAAAEAAVEEILSSHSHVRVEARSADLCVSWLRADHRGGEHHWRHAVGHVFCDAAHAIRHLC